MDKLLATTSLIKQAVSSKSKQLKYKTVTFPGVEWGRKGEVLFILLRHCRLLVLKAFAML